MRTISEDFREELRGVKELIGVVSYRTKGSNLLTQANEFIVTQDNDNIILNNKSDKYKVLGTEHNTILASEVGKILGAEKDLYEIDNDYIDSINIAFNGTLLSTICQSLQIVCKEDIELNTKINVKIGVLVDDEYEWLDMGNFYNIEPSEYQLDKKTYVITAYDIMHKSMIKYNDNPLDIFPCTHRQLLETILNNCGIEYNIPTYTNENRTIEKDYWLGEDVNYRDILNELVMSGGFSAIIQNNKFTAKTFYDTQETIEAEDLKDTNVSIGDLYGPINYVEAKDTSNNIYTIGQDSSSIEQNGLTKYNLGVNRILANDTGYYTNVFNAIKGLSYYTYNLSSTGILIFEPLDKFNIRYNGMFNSIMLNDSISLTTGLKEDLYVEEPKENVSEYTSSEVTTEQIKNAIINVDKANGQIVLKVNSDNRIAEVALNADADEGTAINFKADQIDFSSHTFNLTSDNMTIASDNFSVDSDGNMTCHNATIVGDSLEVNSPDTDPQIHISNKDDLDLNNVETYISGRAYHIQGGSNETFALLQVVGSYDYDIDVGAELYLTGELGGHVNLSGRDGSVSCNEIVVNQIEDEGEFIYIADGNITCTNEIECKHLTQTSSAKEKKDFEKLENALEIVNDTDIYKYHFKSEKDKDKKSIGFVIGDNFKYRKEITDKKNKKVDIYSMLSVLWKAVQEQQKEIEKLKEAIYGSRKDK